MVNLPSGTVTFLFTDIEGSTRLLEKLREQYVTVLEKHRELLRAAFERSRGHEISTGGDSFFVAFERASDAISCAIEAQRSLARHAWPQGITVRVRMGLHTGEPIVAHMDYVGMDVHRAARVAAAGHGGQVLLSQATRDLVYQDLPPGTHLRSLGIHRLKDISLPQQIFQLDIDGLPADFPELKTQFLAEEPPTAGKPPFKGLQYFEEGDAELFFGRSGAIARLLELISQQRFLAVVGASGSGKSSVVRAGLIPALQRSQPGAWDTYVLTPGVRPLESLAVHLTHGLESTTACATLLDDLHRDTRSLHLCLRKGAVQHEREKGKEGKILLAVDQFEELFTMCRDPAERQAFIDNLIYAVQAPDNPAHVLIALRADFYAHLAEYAGLRQAVAKHQEYLGAMSGEELRQAIEQPARRGGWEFSPGLVELMLHEVGAEEGRQPEPGALPLLSHALLETWNHRRGSVMNLRAYAESGGVYRAIARTAERVYTQELTPVQQAIARDIFLRLTELGEGTEDTRRRASLDELLPTGPHGDPKDAQEVLVKLADARLIITGEGTAEVAHEALIREWPTLRKWLTENREALLIHRHLTEAAEEWQLLKRDMGALYRGARLAQAMEWAQACPQELNAQEEAFLTASREAIQREAEEREAQRQRELEAAQKLAEAERRGRDVAENERRIAFARELSMSALNNLLIDPERSILLALEAISVSTVGGGPVLREAEEALHRAVQAVRILLALRGHGGGVHGVAFSQDGKLLATASTDKSAKLWDAATGKELLTLSGHTDTVQNIAFSPDGRRLATTSWDKTAKIWDAATGRELLTLRGHTDQIWGIAFSPDGSRVVTGCLDKTAKLWDAVTGKELLTLVGHTGGVDPVAFSPDGKRIATGSWNDELEHSVKIWDAINGQVLLNLLGHGSGVWGVVFSPDGKRLATCSGDSTIKTWDTTSGQVLMTMFPHTMPLSLAWSRDPQGTRLATGTNGGIGQVWDPSTGELLLTLAGHASAIWGVSFNPDATRLASASMDGTARVWDITPEGSREWLTIAGHPVQARYIAYSPDGSRLATSSLDKTAKVWDSSTGKGLVILGGHTNAVNGLAFSPDGTRLATVSLDHSVRIWDMAAGKQLLNIPTRVFPNPQGPRVAFSPDGKRVAAPGADNTARMWDACTGTELLTLSGHTNAVSGIAFSPDGSRLATGDWDGRAKIWDAVTGNELLTLSGHLNSLMAVKFSPDGRCVATASIDGTAKVWDAETGSLLLTLSGHTGLVLDVAFSSDGLHMATASGDGALKVWQLSTEEAQSEQPLTLYNPNGAMVSGVAFSPDGTRLAASANDGTARIYALPLDDIMAIARSRVTRALTRDECEKYLHVE